MHHPSEGKEDCAQVPVAASYQEEGEVTSPSSARRTLEQRLVALLRTKAQDTHLRALPLEGGTPQRASVPSSVRQWNAVLLDLLALGVILTAYGLLSLPQLDLPGLYYDEAVDAVPAMQLLQGQPVELVRGAGVPWGDMKLPLMAMDYVGAVHTYAAVPFFWLLGAGAVSLRLMTVAGGALTLVLTYALGRSLFDRRVAFLGALLLAVHPSYLFYVRQGVHVSSLLAVCTTGSLLALWRWWTGGRWYWLVAGMFLLGLGLTTKILFVWFINALLAVFTFRLAVWVLGKLSVVSYQLSGAGSVRADRLGERTGSPSGAWGGPPSPGPFLPSLGGRGGSTGLVPPPPKLGRGQPERSDGGGGPHHLSSSEGAGGVRAGLKPASTDDGSVVGFGRLVAAASLAVAGAGAFLLGAAPLLLYNMQTGGTLQVLAENRGVTQSGVDNAAFLANLLTRLETLRVLVNGEHFWFLGGLYGFAPYPWLLAALVVVLPPLLWWHRRQLPGFPNAVGLLALILLLVVPQSAVTVAGLWPTHMFPFLPFLLLLGAAGLTLLARGGTGTLAAGGLTLLLLGGSVVVDRQYHQALAETGGRRAHSDAVTRLAAYLDERGDPAPFALDWGIKASVQLLTQGRVTPLEIFFYSPEPPPLFTDWVYGAMHNPDRHVFIFHAPDTTVFPRLDLFLELAGRWEKEAVLETTIRERDGAPVYLVYSVQ